MSSTDLREKAQALVTRAVVEALEIVMRCGGVNPETIIHIAAADLAWVVSEVVREEGAAAALSSPPAAPNDLAGRPQGQGYDANDPYLQGLPIRSLVSSPAAPTEPSAVRAAHPLPVRVPTRGEAMTQPWETWTVAEALEKLCKAHEEVCPAKADCATLKAARAALVRASQPGGAREEGTTPTDEQLAQQFHEAYERLAPSFGYETRRESAKPWEEVPEANRKLMTAVCAEVRRSLLAAPEGLCLNCGKVWDQHFSVTGLTRFCYEDKAHAAFFTDSWPPRAAALSARSPQQEPSPLTERHMEALRLCVKEAWAVANWNAATWTCNELRARLNEVIGFLVGPPLKEETTQLEWVVNDNAELGVKIGNRFYWLYKGDSLEYKDGLHDDGTPMMWRLVGKREFGECCYPVGLERLGRYTKGEGWRLLASPSDTSAGGNADDR